MKIKKVKKSIELQGEDIEDLFLRVKKLEVNQKRRTPKRIKLLEKALNQVQPKIFEKQMFEETELEEVEQKENEKHKTFIESLTLNINLTIL